MTEPANEAPSPAERPPADAPPAGARGSRLGRPPPGRIAPEALAAARGNAAEGLDWLGRPPEAKASLLVRLLAIFARFVLFRLFRFRVDVEGREFLPRGGGYIVVAAAHRGWMDPFVVLHALPLEPRVWFLGSGPSAFGPRWRESLIHRVGGLLPVWRGGVGVEKHVAAARAVLANGAVFAQMPEGTISGPPGRIGPFRIGSALIALRTGAPVVLLAMAGTDDLYLGRRMAARILPPTSVAELLGQDWDGRRPPEGSRDELDLARTLTDGFAARLGPEVAAFYPRTTDPADHPRRLRERLTWLLIRKGRVDRGNPIGGPTDDVTPDSADTPGASPDD